MGGLDGGVNCRLIDNIAGVMLVVVGEGDAVEVCEDTTEGVKIFPKQIKATNKTRITDKDFFQPFQIALFMAVSSSG